MFIQTEETPNPNSLKFIPEDILISEEVVEFKNQIQAAKSSPLAMQLFQIKGVESIFFGKEFITINKSNDSDWNHLKIEIISVIMEFIISKKNIFFEKKSDSNSAENQDSDIVKQIKELIEVKVRPAVAMDGGDIVYKDFKEGIVYLELRGSCSGCPSSTVTLKNGIETMLKHYVPEVEAVEQVFDEGY